MYKNNDKEIEARINGEIDRFEIAYKIQDEEGNVFVYAGYENNIPIYRTEGGRKHISELTGYQILNKYISL